MCHLFILKKFGPSIHKIMDKKITILDNLKPLKS